ncbi:similar to zinc-binding oxidoreductase CipB [Botrytis cinerea T4]|uniref:Similar to zinc-binding oxidoreductase CipB n=1 Tax=Botryotinia fuckeliana (strain T4) TaxID=999810 RepID=G2XNN1_BOTF4|nr:similar to zinc-binding oxidoreductase CipB [Botrytis cinerea T4]
MTKTDTSSLSTESTLFDLRSIIPINHAAYLVEAKSNPLEVRKAPYPSPEPHTVVVKNHTIAINPVDWKLQDYAFIPLVYPFILGSDVAGEFVEVGSGVTNVARVTGNRDPRYSGFQECTVIPVDALAPIPSSISFEQAAVLPLAISTAAVVLYQKDQLDLPHPSESAKNLAAVQLARASGLEVISTASAHNHDFVKSLWASEVFDHRSKSVINDIVAALKGKRIVGAFDCISEGETQKACADILYKITELLGGYIPKALESGHFKPALQPWVVVTGLQYIQEALEKNKAGLSATRAVVKLP